MDDERLKNPSGWDYFDELLARIREIRASEKRFYQKVRDLFTPAAFAIRRLREMQQWLCETSAEEVTFAHAHNRALHHFPIDTFTVDGVLPWPAG